MKFLILGLLLIIFVHTKTNLKKGKMNKKIDQIGETFTSFGHMDIDAVSEASARVPMTPDEAENLSTPTMVNHLSEESLPPAKGPLEPIDETPTIHEYYDGSLRLNVVKVNCTLYTVKADCIHTSVCGWCGESGKCVLGGNFGPESTCVKSQLIYSAPVASLPQIRNINEPVGGVSSSVISALPY